MAQKKQWMRRGAAFALALTTAASMHAGALATIPVQEDGTAVAQTEPEMQEEQTQTAAIDSASTETAESESAELAESEEIETVAEEMPAVQSVEVNEPESGLRFDSVKNEYVQVQGTVQIPNTVEVWAKIDAKEDRRQIIMNNYGRGGNTWGIEVTVDNTLRYWENTDDSYVDWKSDIEVCTGEWVLISVVRNIEESKIQVYINGEFVDEYDVSGFAENADLADGWLCFGSDYHSTPLPLDGEIAEVRFWDTARTAEEIAQNASYDAVDEAEGLAHLWQLDEAEDLGPDTVFEDQTGKVAVYDGSIDDDADTDDDANLKFGSSGCAFYNNGIAIYLNGKTISGDGNAQITNAIFEKNDCAVYIEELDRSLPSYEYGITYSKFIDNTCDLYYADMYELFLPGNYFGDKHGNARMPQLDGEIITRRYYDKITGQIYTETLDTSTLLNVYPIYDSEDMIDLCILENIDHVMLMDDQANEFLISQDSLLTRTEELTIDVVTKDKALEDSDSVETLDILPVGSWNFAQK